MRGNIYLTGEYYKRNPTWDIEDSPWKASKILKIINRNKLQPHSICEVGCGAGEILNQLYLHMPYDVSFTGYEVSPQAFELCKTRSKDRIHFNLKNILDEDKAFFDMILAIDVFEHIEDYMGFLRKLRGKAIYKIFHIPLDLSLRTVLFHYPLLKDRHDVGHIHYFTKETAIATLIDTGYEIIDYFYTAASVDLPAKSVLSFLARGPRKIMFALNKDLAARVLGRYSLMVLAK
jgi:hypothetical protein